MFSMMKTGIRLAGLFARNQSGSFPVLIAMLSVPLMGMGGMAADHLASQSARQRFDTAADAAALAAINTARRLAQGDTSWAAGPSIGLGHGVILQEARNAGQRAFNAHLRDHGASRVTGFEIDVRRAGNEYIALVQWSGQANSHFGALFKIDSYPLSGSAEARTSLEVYTNVHVVMDFSASMLIGVTQADHDSAAQVSLPLINQSCAFLCHLTSVYNNWTQPTYPAGKGIVRLRIDVMRDAVLRALDDLQRGQLMPNQFRFGVYGFSSNVREFLNINDPRAGRFDDVRAIVRTTDPWPLSGGGTAFHVLFPYLDKAIPPGGDGATPARPRQVMILITDGIDNRNNFDPTGHSIHDPTRPLFPPAFGVMDIQNLNPAFCNGLKAKNVDIIVVRVRYIIPRNHEDGLEFQAIRNTLEPLMPGTLGACASSPSHYLVADSPGEIERAINSAFTLVSPVRLTN